MVDDETLFRTMQVAAKTGALVMVHAENGDAIEVLVGEALAAGNTDPIYHALTRPPETEGEATNRAIQLARVAGAPLYVVHVSCAESVEPLRIAREKGWNVHGETCTQYFFIDQSFLERPNFEGAKYVYTPPPRDKANQDVLWNAVRTDILSAISTDHCAYLFKGQKDHGKDDFSQIPNGGPGPREPAADDPHVRRPRRPDLAEPDGRAAGDEPGEAVRALSAQGHARGRLRRRRRRLRPGEAGDDLRVDAPFALRLQPLRGDRGDRARPRSCCCAATCSSRTANWWRSRGSASSSSARGSARSSSPPRWRTSPDPLAARHAGARARRRRVAAVALALAISHGTQRDASSTSASTSRSCSSSRHVTRHAGCPR